VVIRGYREAWGQRHGGAMDENFVRNYAHARAAGFKRIDTYLFPCTGKTRRCKSPAKQINELVATIKQHKMSIGIIWLDFEVDPDSHNWNYGRKGNLRRARQLNAAFVSTKRRWGIYASTGQWETIFGSLKVKVNNTVPLWNAHWDNNPKTIGLKKKFGGWKKAYGKQYKGSLHGGYDLNIFRS
jgi:GH25 family lysozyme M1 (1,4-beta-N-acetylmuramidase)